MESFSLHFVGFLDKIRSPLGGIIYFCLRVVCPSLQPFKSNSIFFAKFKAQVFLPTLLTSNEIEDGKTLAYTSICISGARVFPSLNLFIIVLNH